MKKYVLLGALIVFFVFNYAIYQKQSLLQQGEIVLLKLVPRDPRSWLQGDYMVLGFEVEEEMNKTAFTPEQKNGLAVITVNDQHIAHFVRFYQGEALALHEKLIKYRYQSNNLPKFTIKPNTFFFQEGYQPFFQKAQFAIFHYQGNAYLLTGLADQNGVKISPERVKEHKQPLFFKGT